MTLEEQIRRMGEARAAAVLAPPWRDVANTEGRGPRRLAIAAAAAVVLAAATGLAIFALGGDDNNTVAGDADGQSAAIRRWVPDGDITSVQYGGPHESWFAVGTDIALVTTPGDAFSLDDDDWTLISRGDTSLGMSGLTDPTVLETRDDVGLLWLPGTNEGEGLVLASRRFGSETLLELTKSLDRSVDVGAIAALIADWAADIDIVYEGPPAVPDISVEAQGSPSIRWIATRSEEQYAATYPPLADGGGFVFGFRGDESVTQGPDFWSDNDAPREVDDQEWDEIHRALTSAITEVELYLRMPRVSRDRDNPDEATELFPTFTAQVAERDESHTIELALDEEVHFEFSDVVGIRLGPFQLIFRTQGSPETTNKLVLDARLSEWEAERLVELINEGVTEPNMAAPAQTGPCATNPVPSDDVLDLAAHIAFDRTPLDLDQDGVDDEMLIYDDADGNWFLLARLQAGWTNALEVGDAVLPSLVPTPGGVPAATDLDDDGGLEFFLARDATTTGRNAGVVSLRGCDLVDEFALADAPDEPGQRIGVPTAPPVDPECGSGCLVRVTCRDNVLVEELVISPASAVDANWTWTTTEVRFVDGAVEINEFAERTGSPLTTTLSGHAPRPEDAGVIDCTP